MTTGAGGVIHDGARTVGGGTSAGRPSTASSRRAAREAGCPINSATWANQSQKELQSPTAPTGATLSRQALRSGVP